MTALERGSCSNREADKLTDESKPRRDWWSPYLATLRKTGNERIAMKAAKIYQAKVMAACAKHPSFAERRNEALAHGAKMAARKVPGRGRGRPRLELTAGQRATILDLYGESGCAHTVAALCGVSVSSLWNLRKRDPVFMRQWSEASERATALAYLAGRWSQREKRFYDALAHGVTLADAARVSGVSPSIAPLLAIRQGMTRKQAERWAKARFEAAAPPPNRFTVPPHGAHPQQVRAAPSVQRAATAAELAATRDAEALEADARRLTPEQVSFIALVADDGMTLDAACAASGRSKRQVAAWCEANRFFRIAINND